MKDSDSSDSDGGSPVLSRSHTPGPYTSMKSPKKSDSQGQLKINIDSDSSDYEFEESKTLSPILKNARKPSVSPKEKSAVSNLTPIMHSEEVHEKSRNNLWEAFITPRDPKEKSKSRNPSVSPREEKKGNDAQDAKNSSITMDDDGKKEETTKKAKIGITIKKSPNSDRTFESKLLNQEFDNMSIKNKILDIGMESEAESVVSEDDLVKKEEMKKSIFVKRKSNESSLSPRSAVVPPPQVPEEVKTTSAPTATQQTATITMNAQKAAIGNNPFTFTNAKKATNDAIQNEILQKEILKRKSEEMNLKPKSPIVSFTSSDSSDPSSSESSSESDSEYEIEEIYQLKEWFPPDHWKADIDNSSSSNTVSITANNHTVTLVESRTSTGLFRKEMRIEADPTDFKM